MQQEQEDKQADDYEKLEVPFLTDMRKSEKKAGHDNGKDKKKKKVRLPSLLPAELKFRH